MSDLLNQLVEFFRELVLTIGYPGIFAVMFTENLFPPVPTDPLLPFAGILVAEGDMVFVVVWVTAVCGALTGTMILYFVGAWADDHVIRRLVTRYGKYTGITQEGMDRAFRLFDTHGAWFILIGRSIPVVRSAVSLTAGMSRMSLPRFVILSTINSAVVTGFWITVGVLLGENWRDVFELFKTMRWPAAVVFIAVVVVLGVYYMRRRNHRRESDAGDSHPVPENSV